MQSLITVMEAADILGISRSGVLYLIKIKGGLRVVAEVGAKKTRLLNRAEVEELASSRRGG